VSAYVDDAQIPAAVGRLGPRLWSHLTADTVDELHAFAAKLGLKRHWYQERRTVDRCHYDVTEWQRDRAIKLGAVAETTVEGAKRRIASRTA
jgi:hypothetical protein